MGQAQTEAGLGSDRRLCSKREDNATVYAVSTQRSLLLPLDCLPSPQTMSDKPQLPGYSVDDDIDDTHDDNDDARHIDVVTAEPERPGGPVLSASAGDAVASTATVSSPTRQDSTQSNSTPPNQQEPDEEHPTATRTTSPLPIDEFADPKIAELHAIFPDYDAAIL
jgi:hypothetical protein